MQRQFDASTNPSIFLRLKADDERPREFAWGEFHRRYSPVIANFARRLGGKEQDIDDVVQDVLLGFFLKSPTFVYDPAKGRFRRYLKVCTYRALQRRFGNSVRLLGKPIDEIDPESVAIDNIWNDVWEQQLLEVALAEVKAEMLDSRTFAAFEQYVLEEKPGEAVAHALGMHINSVYRAKDQITRALKLKLKALREED